MVLFYDNARVHKTANARDELEFGGLLALHNCPYAPDLNFCEKFIKLHKRRLNLHYDRLK